MSLFDVKKLTEDRAKLVHDMNRMTEAVGKEQRAFSKEETDTFDRMFSDSQKLQEQIETANRVSKAAALQVQQPQESREVVRTAYQRTSSKRDYHDAFKCWALSASGNHHKVTDQMRNAADGFKMNLQSVTLQERLQSLDYQYWQYQERAQVVGTPSSGGYLTSSDQFIGLDQALKFYGGARQFGRVVRTSDGAPKHFATEDETGATAEQHTENNTVNNTSVTFGTVTLSSVTYDSGVYPVSIELLTDAEMNIGQLLQENLATRIGRKENTSLTLGTGGVSGGIVTGASLGVTGASATAATFNNLVDLYFSVDKAYRDLPSCQWMMNDATLANVVKLTDTVGHPIWGPGLNGAPGQSIMGKNVVVNNDVAAMTSAAKSILFGAGEKYIIRDINDVIVKVLNERFADSLAVGFIAFHRVDGNMLNSAAVKYFKNATSGT